MSSETKVEVTLQGKTYRLACDAQDAEVVRRAAQVLDERLTQLAAAGMSGEKLLLWAAFDVAMDWVRWQEQGGLDVAELRRKIESMQGRVAQCLAQLEAPGT